MGECLKDPSKTLVCSFLNCKASFSKSWKLEAHYCKHTGLKPFACDNCDKSFCTRYQLTRHNLSHTGEKPYLCSTEGCPESFSSSAGLKNHIARVHQHKEIHYVCNYEGCGKEFHKNKQLKAHTCEHTNQLPFECLYEGCGKKFAASKALKKHEKVHDGYPCAEEGCNFQGKTWTEYQAHRKAKHREILQCDSCTKTFHEAWFLKKHQLKVHLGVRHVFKCTRAGCEKTYTTHFGLQNHILSFHEGKRTFICAHAGCGKAFAMEESLKRHAVVHDPQKKKLLKTSKLGQKKRKSKAKPSASELSAHLENISLNQAKNPKPK
ncbi:general transcription factor IIIA, b isoform X1 [Trichomycterus rosablanca]|uniref:general transcription factor IIIA, b isoform X1 n=1 Tax=Trichomycterus rosablanca TaxID=2290929 RepID=UPI002F35DF17